jgi:hypothetical protein
LQQASGGSTSTSQRIIKGKVIRIGREDERRLDEKDGEGG